MNKYRLHIDIPMSVDLSESTEQAQKLIQSFVDALKQNGVIGQDVNYRLGNDGDRQKSNYLVINENGHVNNKKSKVST